MEHKIAMLVPYVGKLSEDYFDIFLRSCAYNLDIKFLIFNDFAEAANQRWALPPNVEIRQMSLTDFNTRASQALGIEVSVTTGYKLCDLRPMYGRIFAQEVEGCDFWGHCDMDLTLGCIKDFITEEILKQNDIISLRKEWISGPFSLYRNSEYINGLYLLSRDWQRIASRPDYFRFDETGVLKGSRAMPYPLIAAGRSILDLELEAESITALIERLLVEGQAPLRVYRQTHIKESLDKDMILCFDKGQITLLKDGRQFAHYHYITEKNNGFFSFPKWRKVPDIFYIDYTGFYTQHEYEHEYERIRRRRHWAGRWKYYTQALPRRIWRKVFKK